MLSQKEEFLTKYPGIGWSGSQEPLSFASNGQEHPQSGPVSSSPLVVTGPVWLGRSSSVSTSTTNTHSQMPSAPTLVREEKSVVLGSEGTSTPMLPGPRASSLQVRGPVSVEVASVRQQTKQNATPRMGGWMGSVSKTG